MDWQQILSISTDELTEEEKENLFDSIAWLELDKQPVDLPQLKHLFKITQEVLKYKNEQVESLVSELDELAARQGEEEKLKHYDGRQMNEMEALRENYESLQIKYSKTKNDFDSVKNENAKYKQELETLEKEKLNLLLQLQDKNDLSSENDSPDLAFDNNHEMNEIIKEKNRHINQLLSDLEVLEDENRHLKDSLRRSKDEITDGTRQFLTITEELNSMKHMYTSLEDDLNHTKQENSSLRTQIDELLAENEQRDREIERFSIAIDSKVDEWKVILDEKDRQIDDLTVRHSALLDQLAYINDSVASKHDVPNLLFKIQEREEKIIELKEQLRAATHDMNVTISEMERVKKEREKERGKIEENQVIQEYYNELIGCRNEISELRDKLTAAEEDARMKDEELSGIIVQLQKYESSEFGLTEAVNEIHELQKQLAIRNKQIRELINTSNELENEIDRIDTENVILREKLGITGSPIHLDGVVTKQKRQKQLVQKYQMQISNLEEQVVQHKLTIHNLNNTIAKFKADLSGKMEVDTKDCEQDVDKKQGTDERVESLPVNTSEQLDEVIAENEALRNGMHEILNSIQEQQGQIHVEIKSEILEKLLNALDIRHVSGWYHPAMRLQAELISLKGGNKELRHQLRESRKLATNEIQNLSHQKSPSNMDRGELHQKYVTSPNESSRDCSRSSNRDESQSVLQENFDRLLQDSKILEETTFKLKDEIASLMQQLTSQQENFVERKEKLTSEINDLKVKNNDASERIEQIQLENNAYQTQIKAIEGTLDNETLEKLKNAKTYTELNNEKILLFRKCLYYENNEKNLSDTINRLRNETVELQESFRKKETSLSNLVEIQTIKIRILEKTMRTMIPMVTFENVESQLQEITYKYNQNLERQKLHLESSQQIELETLQKKYELLKNEKRSIREREITGDNYPELTDLQEALKQETQKSEHIHNLYTLIHDQMQKLEQRLIEIERENATLQLRNLELQKRNDELSNFVTKSVTLERYHALEMANEHCNSEIEELKLKNVALNSDLRAFEEKLRKYKLYDMIENMELINLKHLVIDLQATTDDKATIARLSSELVIARIREIESEKIAEKLKDEMTSLVELDKERVELARRKDSEYKSLIDELTYRIKNLEDIIFHLKRQYSGCIPIYTLENLLNKLTSLKMKQAYINEQQLKTEALENDATLKLCEYNVKLRELDELKSVCKHMQENGDAFQRLDDIFKQKINATVNEIRYRKKFELKSKQFDETLTLLYQQQDDLIKLEQKLIENSFLNVTSLGNLTSNNAKNSIDHETQTELNTIDNECNTEMEFDKISDELLRVSNLTDEKSREIEQLTARIADLEKCNHNLNADIATKEDELLVMKRSVDKQQTSSDVEILEQLSSLKAVIVNLNNVITQKDESIKYFQNTLEESNDEYSKSKVIMEEEIKRLNEIIQKKDEKSLGIELKNITDPTLSEDVAHDTDEMNNNHQNDTQKLQKLETHVDELHTALKLLDSQLTASRMEASRWKNLADDRLQSIDQLRKKLEEQHQLELTSYKDESETWRKNNDELKYQLSKLRSEISQESMVLGKKLAEKDAIIYEMEIRIKELMEEVNYLNQSTQYDSPSKVVELEVAKKKLKESHDNLKKQLHVATTREKTLREEVQNLKLQLLKRPVISARVDKLSDKNFCKDQQRRINQLERELEDTNQKLAKETAQNETRRAKTAEELALWDKQKRWQQMAERFKERLKLKTDECDKYQQNNIGLKAIITKLEREKHMMEMKLKQLRGSQVSLGGNKLEMLELENAQLRAEIDVLNAKLDMNKFHSSSVGASLVEEKLEDQERKIAALELSARSSTSVAMEIERLQKSNKFLSKENTRLEAVNLELSLEIKTINEDVPRMKDEIHYLKNYIEVLKSERSDSPAASLTQYEANKKVNELEKTIFILKRVVEKLQAENRKLHAKNTQDKKFSSGNFLDDKLKNELFKLKQQYKDCVKTNDDLESKLSDAQSHIKLLENTMPESDKSNDDLVHKMRKEMLDMRHQLKQKSELLDKVKELLHRAAVKEKTLNNQIQVLKCMLPDDKSISSERMKSD